MACNCVNEERLKALYRKYGEKTEEKREKSLIFRLKETFYNLLIILLLIPYSVYLLFYILRESKNNDGKVSIAKFFGFEKEKLMINV